MTKTYDRFLVKAVNTTCHAINRLYLHHLLKKMPYELLIGNKPNVYYFQVFGSKCYVRHKGAKSPRFAPKVYEGFLLGYVSDSCACLAFNMDSGCVETTSDVEFDETNGSQVEQYDLDVIDDEEAPCDALRRLANGDVRPQEITKDHPSSNEVTPSTQANDQDREDERDKDKDQKIKMRAMKNGGVVQDEEGDGQEESRSPPPHP
jgi:hypothetical protein